MMAAKAKQGLTPKRRSHVKWSAFLNALRESPNVTKACALAGCSRQAPYDRRERDQAFAEEWDRARAIGVRAAEAEAWRRGQEGEEIPIYHEGELVGTRMKRSDTLLIFMLKAHGGECYREKVDSRVDFNDRTKRVFDTATDDELAREAERAALAAEALADGT